MRKDRFFRVSSDASHARVYPWVNSILAGRLALPKCPVCCGEGYTYQGTVEASLLNGKGVVWPDWLSGANGPRIVFSERVLEVLQQEGLGEFPHDMFLLRQPIYGLLKNKKQPSYFWIDIDAIVGAKLDFEASYIITAVLAWMFRLQVRRIEWIPTNTAPYLHIQFKSAVIQSIAQSAVD